MRRLRGCARHARLRVNFLHSKAPRNVASKEDHVKRLFATLLAASRAAFMESRRRRRAGLAQQAGAHRQHLRARRRRRLSRAHRRRQSLDRVRPAVLRRDALRRGRRDRRQLGRGDAARRLQLRHHQHHHAGAGADQQSEARLSSGARPHQHRLSRRLADRAVGEREEPDQDARRFRRLREEERQAADLFVVGRRQQRASVRRDLRPARSASRSSTCPTRARRRACSISSAATSCSRRRP